MMQPKRMARPVTVFSALVLCAGGALAQPAPPKRVEAGAADVGPSRISTAQLEVDLRQPTSFESVYELHKNNAFASPGQETTPFFMRQNGGISAVFPRSRYANTPGGLVAQIPPGTIFYIGKLPETFKAAKPTHPHAPNWLDTSVEAVEKQRDAAAAAPPKAAEPIPPAPDRSIFADDEFRKHRVARLLERAEARADAPRK